MTNKKTLRCAVLLLTLVMASCDSLEVTDPNAPNAADVSVQSLVSGLEGSLRTDLFVYIVGMGTLAREVYNLDPADPRWTGELLTGPLDPGGFVVLRPWGARYQAIGNALTLQERATSDLSGAEQSAASGFVSTIVGYQLLLNLNYLGDNGIKIEFSTDITVPFVGPDQAYAAIERYLDDGYAQLTQGGAAFPFQLTEGFAGFDTPASFAQFNRALRARVAIYQNDFDAALAALGDSFVNADGGMDLGVFHVYSTGSGDMLNPLFSVPTAPAVKLRAHPLYGERRMPGDRRFATKILDRSDDPDFDPAPVVGGGLSSVLVATVAENATAPLPILRREELLLIRAEANVGKGNLAAATADVNQVRAAAGLDPITLTTGNALDVLLHERMYSLFLEGHRLVDVRRHGRLARLPIDRTTDVVFGEFPRPLDEVPTTN